MAVHNYAADVFDMLPSGIILLFGVIRIGLSTMQVAGWRFYGKRDLFDIYTGTVCMFVLPVLLFFGKAGEEGWQAVGPFLELQLNMAATFLLFHFVTMKALIKYRKTKRSLSKNGHHLL